MAELIEKKGKMYQTKLGSIVRLEEVVCTGSDILGVWRKNATYNVYQEASIMAMDEAKKRGSDYFMVGNKELSAMGGNCSELYITTYYDRIHPRSRE